LEAIWGNITRPCFEREKEREREREREREIFLALLKNFCHSTLPKLGSSVHV
jgi:hypothetical protein